MLCTKYSQFNYFLCFVYVLLKNPPVTARSIVESITETNVLEENIQLNVFAEASPGDFDTPINGSVSAGKDEAYVFTYDYYVNQPWAIYVCVRSNASEHAPLLVVIRQSLSVTSWKVPLTFSDASLKNSKVCHTLCPLANYFDPWLKEHQLIFMDFSTTSSDKVSYVLEVSNLTNFVIGTSDTLLFNITPSEPQVLEYQMPDNLNSVVIEAKSSEENCMILAIQDIQCPFYDSERTVEYKGFYQTMTKQSGITVTRKTFKEGKIYVVMILKPVADECYGEFKEISTGSMKSKEKKVLVNVRPSISDNEFYTAVFGAFGVFILIYIFSFIICCFLFVRKRRSTLTSPELQNISENNPSIQSYGTITVSSGEESDINSSTANVYTVGTEIERPRRDSACSIDETDMDKLPDAELDKDVVRTKTMLYVSDLSRKKDKYLSDRTKVYSWNLLTVAVFYGLPVVQLVYINQKIVNLTGNQDLCYYNFLCSHKICTESNKCVQDFNHVYSNIGYVMLGILFLLLVWRREVLDSDYEKETKDTNPKDLLGIPHHFGFYYAMGWALIMEGILSASYHICPNRANFQFDTAFMYVIATLCMLKLYQARHPDITAKPHNTWMLLSVVLLIGVVGVLQGGTLFWIIFVLGHIAITFLVSTTIYYMGRWQLDRWIFKRTFQYVKLDVAAGSFRPTYLGRFIVLSLAVALNIAVDLYGLITRPKNFAAFLLGVFIMNLLVYLIYYTIMKVRYKERIRWIPLMYMILSFVCWGVALHFFLLKNTSWQDTPALSRERNVHCVLLQFYDDHDVWHFFSSCALFFSFMVLFTLDDDLQITPRSLITVF